MQRKVLEARVEKAGYRGGFALSNVNFELREGDVLVVTGRSGSGKTTLIKALLGILELEPEGFFHGTSKIYGVEPRKTNPRDIFSLVAYIPQDPWFGIVTHVVYVEFCLSLSIVGKSCDLERLKPYGLYELKDQITYGLSAGETQRLLWASNVEKGSKVFVLDEPGVYIDLEGRKFFKKVIKEEVINNDKAAIIVDHDPLFWKDLNPKLLVLEKGEVRYFGEFADEYAKKIKLDIKLKEPSTEVILKASNIKFRYPGSRPILNGINVNLKRGEVLGVKGPNGSGKTTLLKVLAGIYKPKEGKVNVRERAIYVPENPLLFFSGATPREELSFADLNDPKVRDLLRGFSIEDLLDRPLARLSSGERRRVAMVSAYLRGFDIFLLDEPSGGLDNYSLEALIRSIERLSWEGKGVIIASHDPRLEPLYHRECEIKGGALSCSS